MSRLDVCSTCGASALGPLENGDVWVHACHAQTVAVALAFGQVLRVVGPADVDAEAMNMIMEREIANAKIRKDQREAEYREDAPCDDGECKHSYDEWPAGSVTARDRAFDQCEHCGWTETAAALKRGGMES